MFPCILISVFCILQFSESAPRFKRRLIISTQPETIGNTKTLVVDVTGNPTPVYRWYKDGIPKTDNNVTSFSLQQTNLERADAGYYHCVALNQHGAVMSNKAELIVACK